jgi:hypothetical protein
VGTIEYIHISNTQSGGSGARGGESPRWESVGDIWAICELFSVQYFVLIFLLVAI